MNDLLTGDDYPPPNGTGIRDYIYLTDLAEGHLAAINYIKDSAGWNVFNLGTGLGSSVLGMVASFKKAIGK